jgi:TonB family protein
MSWNESAWFMATTSVALKSTAVLGAAWILSLLLRGRSAAARHLVWTAAASAVLALPFFSVSLPDLPVPAPGLALGGPGALFEATATAGAGQTITSTSPEAAPGTAPLDSRRPGWRLWLMLLWAAGTAAAFARMLAACAWMRRVRRYAAPASYAADLAIAPDVDADVLETADATMPMTFGILRPAIFLPAEAAAWDRDRLRIVLLHELAHVKRGDLGTHLIARAALALNWWNPLAWLAWREFVKERERAADDMVLNAGARPTDYAGQLLDLARAMQSPPALGWVAVAMARRSQLEGRLVSILDSRLSRAAVSRASTIAMTLLAVALAAPLAAVRAQETTAIPADVDATIRAAVAQKNHQMLDKAAVAFEALRQYETAQRLLESSAAIREQVSGSQSVEYGLGLLKIGDLETNRRRGAEAEAFYTKAVLILGERPETARALMYLGWRKKDPAEAIDFFKKAQRLDPALTSSADRWMALIRERESNAPEAEILYKSSLGAAKPDSADAINTLQLYSRFLLAQGRDAEAKSMAEQAATALKSYYAQAAAGAKDATAVFKVGGDVKPPSVLGKVEPAYSQEARFARYSGTVVLYLEVTPEGVAQNIHIVKGLGMGLDESAIDAIGKWRFRPGTKDGAPVTVAAHVEVNFKLL